MTSEKDVEGKEEKEDRKEQRQLQRINKQRRILDKNIMIKRRKEIYTKH